MASWPSNGDVLRIAWQIGGTMTLHCQVHCILLAIRNVGNDALEGVDMIARGVQLLAPRPEAGGGGVSPKGLKKFSFLPPGNRPVYPGRGAPQETRFSPDPCSLR